MAAPAFEDLLHALELAHAGQDRLTEVPVPPPDYAPEAGVMTLVSVERYKQALAQYEGAAATRQQAEQAVATAQAALDAWFPAPVAAAFDQGNALVAPMGEEVVALLRHNGAYLIGRGATPQEALDKLERFLNQF